MDERFAKVENVDLEGKILSDILKVIQLLERMVGGNVFVRLWVSDGKLKLV